MLNIVIIGAGRGGTALIQQLHDAPNTRIVGVSDLNVSAPGIRLARRFQIPVFTDYKQMLALTDIQFIVDVTGEERVRKEIDLYRRPAAEVISGRTAKFLWEQILERDRRTDTLEQLLSQYQSIYDIGLKLTASNSLSRLLDHLLEDATKLTHTPAGSVVLFDEGRAQMYFGALKGFSHRFSKTLRWDIRKGGLTHAVLNHKGPLVIGNIGDHPGFNNPVVLNEGIRSLMAASLISQGKIIGIVYVNDFKPRRFTQQEISLLRLTSSIAATSIDKARSLEVAMALAITDELTGLYNHRYFVQRLSQEIRRAGRYHRTLLLALLDIDYFKQYNDTFGHLGGNEVLRQLAGVIKEEVRDVDVIARFGGEEFAVIMPETSSKKAEIALSRLRKRVAEFPFRGREKLPRKKITVSIGVGAYPLDSLDAHNLIQRADEALYEAKDRGRNRVVFSAARKRTGRSGKKTVRGKS
jgi:diguanylate cyclase (GGDEF)-like protein